LDGHFGFDFTQFGVTIRKNETLWACLASMDPAVITAEKPPETGKSFAQALSCHCDLQLNQFPPKIVMGTSVRIKISQAEYEFGVADCRYNLHGRVTLHKGIHH